MDEPLDPVAYLLACIERAAKNAPFDSTAAALATANRQGQPSVRFVLAKQVDAAGAVFFTNCESRKGNDLAENPYAVLCFYWPWIGEQVRIEGSVTRVDDREADAYFKSRPRGSQLGALVSQQSRPLSSRSSLLKAYMELESQLEEQPVARPAYWTGFRIALERIEFWKQGDYRLHERLLCVRTAKGWDQQLLFP